VAWAGVKAAKQALETRLIESLDGADDDARRAA